MAIGLYMDEHAPGPVIHALRTRSMDVLRAQDDLPEGTPDPVLLTHATELGRALVSFDDDFLAETARRQREGESFSCVAYAHPQSLSIGQCVRDLELIAKTLEPSDLRGRVIHLPL